MRALSKTNRREASFSPISPPLLCRNTYVPSNYVNTRRKIWKVSSLTGCFSLKEHLGLFMGEKHINVVWPQSLKAPETLVCTRAASEEHMEIFALLLPQVTSQQAHSGWTMFTDATNTNGYLLSSEHHLPPGFSYEHSHDYS